VLLLVVISRVMGRLVNSLMMLLLVEVHPLARARLLLHGAVVDADRVLELLFDFHYFTFELFVGLLQIYGA